MFLPTFPQTGFVPGYFSYDTMPRLEVTRSYLITYLPYKLDSKATSKIVFIKHLHGDTLQHQDNLVMWILLLT